MSPNEGSLSSFLSASGRPVMMPFYRILKASEIAEFRRKEISYCLRFAAGAPSSGAGVKMMTGCAAMMNSPTLFLSAIATPGSDAH